MLWTLTLLTFAVTAGVLFALIYAFAPGETGVGARLSRLLNTSARLDEKKRANKNKERVREALASVGKMVPAAAATATSKSQLMMIRAGYRSADAAMAIRGFRLLLPVMFVVIALTTGAYRYNPFLVLGVALVAGYFLPEMWLMWRIQKRQHRLRQALPDGLDLLVICVEVGLGLDQALLRVAQELQVVHPELSEELQLVNREMRVGKTRIEALRELARRTGLEDIKSLVAMLIQTERFGTSIAQSLRVHSDDLRTRRRQRAEEMSAKTTVKMVPPLVLFIFPALMVVILGPAVIGVVRQLLPALKH
ncbi:MAG: type II secretion system F family protein [Candidatus Acidiferrales bacterium]